MYLWYTYTTMPQYRTIFSGTDTASTSTSRVLSVWRTECFLAVVQKYVKDIIIWLAGSECLFMYSYTFICEINRFQISYLHFNYIQNFHLLFCSVLFYMSGNFCKCFCPHNHNHHIIKNNYLLELSLTYPIQNISARIHFCLVFVRSCEVKLLMPIESLTEKCCTIFDSEWKII